MYVAPPDGAALPSILAAQAALSSRFPDAGECFGCLGLNAAMIASRYFLDKISAATLLERHTLAPVLLAVREAHDAAAFRKRLEEGKATTADIAQARNQLPIARAVRRCPQCVAVDCKKVGWAFARRAHQLIPVEVCSTHQCPLEEVCSACGNPFWTLARYPRDRYRSVLSSCQVCGCSDGKPLPAEPSRASADLSIALERCLAGRIGDNLRPASILSLSERLANWAAVTGNDLHELFVHYWSSESFAAACSSASASTRQMDWVMAAHAIPADSYTTLAFWCFACAHLPPDCELPRDGANFHADPIMRDTTKIARQFGLPSVCVGQYLSGMTIHHVKHRGWSVAALQLMLEALPRDLRCTVEARHKQARFARGHPQPNEMQEYAQDLRQRQRQRALAHIEKGVNTRARFRHAARDLAQWLEEEDGLWFASVLHDGRGRRRDPGTFRSRVLQILAAAEPWSVVERNPYFIRRERHGVQAMGKRALGYYRLICQIDPTAYLWMLKNDRAWFRRTVGRKRPAAAAL